MVSDGDRVTEDTKTFVRGIVEWHQKKRAGLAARLTNRQAVLLTIVLISAAGFSTTAAAQSIGDVESAMCGTGIGQLVGFAFIAAALYFLLKAVFGVMSALDKMESTSQHSNREGKEKLVSSAQTAFAAFVPALAAGIFEVMGINTVSCLSPGDWSIIGSVVVGIPV